MSQRQDVLEAWARGHWHPTELCARFGISRKPGYKWWHRYEAGGLAALVDQSRRPDRSPSALDAALGALLLSTQSRRSAEAQLRTLIAKCAPAHRRLTGALRRSLRKRLPTAHELAYEYSDCFVISFSPNERGYEGVPAIRAGENGVRLYFNRGTGLRDPDTL